MYPFLFPDLLGYLAPMYDLLIVFGVLLMLFYVANRFEKVDGYSRKQTNRLLVLIVISLGGALASSYLFDGLFHTIQEGEVTFGSITFLGGLFGGLTTFLVLQHYFFKVENKDLKSIMNTLLTGVVLAHAFGRIGCFCAGCCFGIPTDSFLGVVFPHGEAHIHYGEESLFPTQLFESAFLFGLFFMFNKVKSLKGREVELYLVGYGLFRVLIEFIRADNRGSVFSFIALEHASYPTPSQYMSLLMVGFGIYLLFRKGNKVKV